MFFNSICNVFPLYLDFVFPSYGAKLLFIWQLQVNTDKKINKKNQTNTK